MKNKCQDGRTADGLIQDGHLALSLDNLDRFRELPVESYAWERHPRTEGLSVQVQLVKVKVDGGS